MKLQIIMLIWHFIALSFDFQVLSEPAQTENLVWHVAKLVQQSCRRREMLFVIGSNNTGRKNSQKFSREKVRNEKCHMYYSRKF